MELSNDAKNAILNCLANAAWSSGDAQTYYDALAAAFFPVDSITAVYTQSGEVTVETDLDDLREDLVVTAVYEGGDTETVTSYTLSGTLTVGTSTITVSYAGKSTTFNVTVSDVAPIYINAVGLGWKTGTDNVYIYINNSGAANRLSMLAPSGDHPLGINSGATPLAYNVYPMNVPSGATTLTITVPSTIASAANFVKWDGNNWIRQTTASNWNYGEHVYDVSTVNDGTFYWGVCFRNQANSNAVNSEDTTSWTYVFS